MVEEKDSNCCSLVISTGVRDLETLGVKIMMDGVQRHCDPRLKFFGGARQRGCSTFELAR